MKKPMEWMIIIIHHPHRTKTSAVGLEETVVRLPESADLTAVGFFVRGYNKSFSPQNIRSMQNLSEIYRGRWRM